MKTKFTSVLKYSVTAVFLAGVLVFASCSEDEPVVNLLVGKYKLTAATYSGLTEANGTTAAVATSIVVPTGLAEPPTTEIDIAVDSDIIVYATGVLNGVPECSDATTLEIVFAEDGSLFITCGGSTEGLTPTGTWTEGTESVTLNVSPTTALPTGLSLTIAGYTVTATNLSGSIVGFPLPKDVTQDLGTQLSDGTINLQLVTVAASLNRSAL